MIALKTGGMPDACMRLPHSWGMPPSGQYPRTWLALAWPFFPCSTMVCRKGAVLGMFAVIACVAETRRSVKRDAKVTGGTHMAVRSAVLCPAVPAGAPAYPTAPHACSAWHTSTVMGFAGEVGDEGRPVSPRRRPHAPGTPRSAARAQPGVELWGVWLSSFVPEKGCMRPSLLHTWLC